MLHSNYLFGRFFIIISIFLPSFASGGAEKVMLTIAENISKKGFIVEILVLENKGALKNKVPKNIKIISLNSSRAIFSFFGVF